MATIEPRVFLHICICICICTRRMYGEFVWRAETVFRACVCDSMSGMSTRCERCVAAPLHECTIARLHDCLPLPVPPPPSINVHSVSLLSRSLVSLPIWVAVEQSVSRAGQADASAHGSSAQRDMRAGTREDPPSVCCCGGHRRRRQWRCFCCCVTGGAGVFRRVSDCLVAGGGGENIASTRGRHDGAIGRSVDCCCVVASAVVTWCCCW